MAKNLQPGVARLVKGLETGGPNLRKLADSMGESEPTIRYWLKEKLMKQGFAIQAVPAFGALGLRRVGAFIRVSKDYSDIARNVFVEMSQSSYLSGFAGSILDDSYLLQWCVPFGAEARLARLILRLKDTGFASRVNSILPFEWSRVVPMRVDMYDFRRSMWDMDLSKDPKSTELKISPEAKQPVDESDLLILRRLQVDARITEKEIAKRLGYGYKRVLRHHAHVFARRLVSGYRVRWPGTQVDPTLGRPRTARHAYLPVNLAIRGVSGYELKSLMFEIHRLPFLWLEAGGHNYYCEIAIPLDLANETLLHIKRTVAPFAERTTILIANAGESMSFSIAPELFNERSKSWIFEPEESLERIEKVLLTAKRRSRVSD